MTGALRAAVARNFPKAVQRPGHGIPVVTASTEIQRLLVGSVADKVIRMAACPVMTIRQAA